MTPAQLTTLKTAILADPALAALVNIGQYGQVKDALNQAATPNYYVWRSTTPASDILDGITWASLTPADTPDSTAAYTNRALLCQAKQLNLQIMLQGRESLATGKLNIRQGLQDALINVPAGVGGAMVDAGWAGAGKVKATITRTASIVEKLLATGSGTTGTPSSMGFEGPLTERDVEDALVRG